MISELDFGLIECRLVLQMLKQVQHNALRL